MRIIIIVIFLVQFSCAEKLSDNKSFSEEVTAVSLNHQVTIYPPHRESFSCSQHWVGQFQHVGDALGSDCIIKGAYQDAERLFFRAYKNEGFENTDWFGWNKNVFAPCDCEILKVHQNDQVNKPGIMKPGRAASIRFKRNDGVVITIAHLRNIKVKEGDKVKAGQQVAQVGNNGYSRNPHVHIGAWLGADPLSIVMDQKFLDLNYREVN